jgi:hypothetical protein
MHFPLSLPSPMPEALGTASRRRFQVASHPPVTALQCSVTSWLLYMSYRAQLLWAGGQMLIMQTQKQ